MWWYTVIILGLQRQRKRREAFSHLWLQSDSRVKMCYQRPYLEKRNRNLSKELRSLSFKNGLVVCFRMTFSKDIKLFIELMFFRLYFCWYFLWSIIFMLFYWNFIMFIWLFEHVCICAHMHTMVYLGRPEDIMWELVLSFHYVGPCRLNPAFQTFQ